jgi:hypothetical protein
LLGWRRNWAFVASCSISGVSDYKQRAMPELNTDRGRDAYRYAPTAQSRTCGFPAYGFHLGYYKAVTDTTYPMDERLLRPHD